MDKYFGLKRINDLIVVKFAFSELSIEETQQFKTDLYNLLSDINNKFIIDASKCYFLPSMVLGVLVSFNAKVKEKNGKVVFCCLTEQVKTIFRITKLEKIFGIYETREEAINSFK